MKQLQHLRRKPCFAEKRGEQDEMAFCQYANQATILHEKSLYSKQQRRLAIFPALELEKVEVQLRFKVQIRN